MNGITTDEEEYTAESMADVARKDKEYFINQNLEDINRWIRRLEKILEEMGHNWAAGNYPRYMIETGIKYIGQTDDCMLRGFSVVDTCGSENQCGICNDTAFIQKLIDGYEEVKKDFIKRLDTYLKRYGTSKVKSWSYIRD